MAAKKCAGVGVSDHAGHAVLVTATRAGELLDRRDVPLIDAGLPAMPHHHEGQSLPIDEAVALVARVRASAERHAAARLDELSRAVAHPIAAIALRVRPALPPTVAERIQSYRAMCVADWVMYRQVLADAASARGWRVRWYDAAEVAAEAATSLRLATMDDLFARAKKAAGPPWRAEHRMALAAAIVAAHA